jgi:hypothetical protein
MPEVLALRIFLNLFLKQPAFEMELRALIISNEMCFKERYELACRPKLKIVTMPTKT